jgi:hypothetical protein
MVVVVAEMVVVEGVAVVVVIVPCRGNNLAISDIASCTEKLAPLAYYTEAPAWRHTIRDRTATAERTYDHLQKRPTTNHDDHDG